MRACRRVLTVQDLSCLGQVAGAAALPVLSCCGLETCLLPTALLSNHTAARFGGFTFRDLTPELEEIAGRWQSIGVRFDAVTTGYLGSKKQVQLVLGLLDSLGKPGCKAIIDPAMADGGRLYSGFDRDFVREMGRLCARADVLLPNLTEACLLTDTPYREDWSRAELEALAGKLGSLGPKAVVITGVSLEPQKTGAAVWDGGALQVYQHEQLGRRYNGTGDLYAAAFAGSWLTGHSLLRSAQIAADFVVAAIRATQDDPDHWYGVKFEKALPTLMELLK